MWYIYHGFSTELQKASRVLATGGDGRVGMLLRRWWLEGKEFTVEL